MCNYSVAHVEPGLSCSIVGWVVEYPSLSCRSSLCIYTSACILLPSHSDRPRQSMASAASVNPSSWSPTCQAKFINLRLPTAMLKTLGCHCASYVTHLAIAISIRVGCYRRQAPRYMVAVFADLTDHACSVFYWVKLSIHSSTR